MATVPKAMLEGATEIEGVGGGRRDPRAKTVAGEFEAVLRIVTVPLWLPSLVGENTTLKPAVCPADNASGSASPVTVKAAPVGVICEMLTLELPVLVSVTICIAVVPTLTLP